MVRLAPNRRPRLHRNLRAGFGKKGAHERPPLAVFCPRYGGSARRRKGAGRERLIGRGLRLDTLNSKDIGLDRAVGALHARTGSLAARSVACGPVM